MEKTRRQSARERERRSGREPEEERRERAKQRRKRGKKESTTRAYNEGTGGRSLWFWSTGRVAVRGNNLRALMTNRVAVLARQELASLRHVANACAAFAPPSTDLFTTCCRPIPPCSSRVVPMGPSRDRYPGKGSRGYAFASRSFPL